MLRLVVVLTVTAALLPGCFGKDPSQAEMERQAALALDNFRADVLEDGRLGSIHVTGWIRVETEASGFPLKVQLAPDVQIRLGTGGKVLIEGTLASMRFTGYCDPQHIVTVTENTEQYGIPEGRLESRNDVGRCAGPGTEQLLLRAFEFELIDPVLLTGQVDADHMTAVSFEHAGKGKVDAQYTATGPEGETTLYVRAQGDKVTQIVADNVDSHLVMDMAYDERSDVAKPTGAVRVASQVSGTTRIDDNGWHWRGITREGGPIGEYSLSVYEAGTQVPCGGEGPASVMRFGLGGDPFKESKGWRLIVTEDGDGKLGMGDELLLSPPSAIVDDFDHEIVIHDDWAGRRADDLGCATPGFATTGALGVLAALGLVLRRR